MEPVLIAVCLLGGLLAGALIGWFAMKAKVGPELGQAQAQREEGENAKAELAAERNRLEQLIGENRGLQSQIEAERNAALEQKKLLEDAQTSLADAFKALSSDALRKNNTQFLELAKETLNTYNEQAKGDLDKRQQAIDNLVKPLQEGIKATVDAAKEMESKREKAFGTIEEQLKQTVEQAAEVARQTSGLKDALKKPNVRGRWGEVQLRNCIELAGMEEHCDVEFQASTRGPEEELVRPDAIVRMPGGRRIAVDAKTPMDPFIQYIDATTDEERNAALIRHGRSVRTHISDLAKADYMQKVAGSPDFVVMFLPNESFLAMALEKEPSLMEDSLNKKVLITTPGTLIGLLKVVRYGWNEEKIALNAQLIANEGAKLNTEIVRFLEDFARLGKAIRAASDAYDDSSRRVEKQITNSSQKLTQLGAKSRKALSSTAGKMLAIGDGDAIASEDEPVTMENASGEIAAEAESDGMVTHAVAFAED